MARGRSFIAAFIVGVALAGLSFGIRGADEKGKAAGSVGAKTCATCHEDAVKGFRAGAHGRAMAAKSADMLERSCVGCHGDAAAHADNPAKTNINRNPGKEACLACHPKAESLMALNLPAHPRNGVACLDCHTPGHTPTPAKALLAAEPRVVCAKCHGDIAAAFKLPFAHRKGDEGFNCTACHTVHGENRTGRLAQWGRGGVCTECHTDKAGPFVYTHPPRDANGCGDCHQPHGSVNPKMLTRNRVADLCIECHTGILSFHDLGRAKFQNCTTCHLAVHGSNHEKNLKDE